MTMTRKISYALAAVALFAAGTASAEMINLGSIDAPATKNFSRDFDHDNHGFTDQISFWLTETADLYGKLWADDSKWLDVDLSAVELFKGGISLGGDDNYGNFSFAGLSAGFYSLKVYGDVDNQFDWWESGDAKYSGQLKFVAAPASSVPEPGSFLLTGIGLLALGLAMRRRIFT